MIDSGMDPFIVVCGLVFLWLVLDFIDKKQKKSEVRR